MPKIKYQAYVINLEYESIQTHWIAFYDNSDNVIYFDSIRVEHIQKEIKKFIDNRNITATILEHKHMIQ